MSLEDTNFPALAVDAFLLQAINGGTMGDRDFILRMETALLTHLYKREEPTLTVDDLNSYRRMLLHRVARYYGLERMADGSQRTVTVFRAPSGHRRALLRLADMVEPEALEPPLPLATEETKDCGSEGHNERERGIVKDANSSTMKKMVIMRRSTVSPPPTHPRAPSSFPSPAQRSLEERERAYEEARARIFQASDEGGGRDGKGHADNGTANTSVHGGGRVGEGGGQRQRAQIQLSRPCVAVKETAAFPKSQPGVGGIHFEGWKDLDAIRPFIPTSTTTTASTNPSIVVTAASVTNTPSPPPSSLTQDAFDYGSVWVPQHIFVLEQVPMDDAVALKRLKILCRRHHCKLITLASEGSRALLLFSYQVGKSEDELEGLLGRPCIRWRPLYLPEPPI